MCLEHEQQEHKFRFKNTNPEIKIQKLKISKSPFSQTQQNHQILKPQSTKSIQKYNTTNPNKKISNSEKPISIKLYPANPPHSQKPKLKTTKTKYKNQNQNANSKHYEDFSDSLISFNLLLFSKQFH